MNPEERFWSKVKVGAPDECWPWTPGPAMKSGHGRFRPGGRDVPKMMAHRYAYESKVGFIPSELDVLHSCDNPLCCNPDHLRIGSHAENMRDMKERGRSVRTRGNAKLTADQAAAIRSNPSHKSQAELAREFGVSKATVSGIMAGHTWQDGGR